MNRQIRILAEFLEANQDQRNLPFLGGDRDRAKKKRRKGGGLVVGWVVKEERHRNGTGISHLGERKEEEGLVQSWVEEKCGHLVLSCSVSFLLGADSSGLFCLISHLHLHLGRALKARSLHPWLQPRIAFSRCLPPAAAVFCANPGHLAHRRSPTRTRAPRYNGWAALQLPRRRGRASGSAAAICDTHSSYGGIPAPIFGTARPCSQDRAPTSSLPNTGASCASLSAAAAARARLRLGRHHRRRASRPSTGWVRARRCRIEAAPSMTGKSWRIEAALNAGDSPGSQGGSHRRSTQLFFLVPPVLPGSTDVLPAHKRIRDPRAPQRSGYHRPSVPDYIGDGSAAGT
jgi:hypothetical protein